MLHFTVDWIILILLGAASLHRRRLSPTALKRSVVQSNHGEKRCKVNGNQKISDEVSKCSRLLKQKKLQSVSIIIVDQAEDAQSFPGPNEVENSLTQNYNFGLIICPANNKAHTGQKKPMYLHRKIYYGKLQTETDEDWSFVEAEKFAMEAAVNQNLSFDYFQNFDVGSFFGLFKILIADGCRKNKKAWNVYPWTPDDHGIVGDANQISQFAFA